MKIQKVLVGLAVFTAICFTSIANAGGGTGELAKAAASASEEVKALRAAINSALGAEGDIKAIRSLKARAALLADGVSNPALVRDGVLSARNLAEIAALVPAAKILTTLSQDSSLGVSFQQLQDAYQADLQTKSATVGDLSTGYTTRLGQKMDELVRTIDDSAAREDMMSLMRKFRQMISKKHLTQQEVEQFADALLVLGRGKVILDNRGCDFKTQAATRNLFNIVLAAAEQVRNDSSASVEKALCGGMDKTILGLQPKELADRLNKLAGDCHVFKGVGTFECTL